MSRYEVHWGRQAGTNKTIRTILEADYWTSSSYTVGWHTFWESRGIFRKDKQVARLNGVQSIVRLDALESQK